MKKTILTLVVLMSLVLLLFVGAVGCDKAKDLLFKAPEDVQYDGQYITWKKVDGAKYYTVKIDEAEPVRSNSTTYMYASNKVVNITVTAVYSDAEKSTSVTFKPLSTIERINVNESGDISWDPVAGANAYLVNINGTTETVYETTIVGLPTGNNRVKIKPIVSGDSSFYSSYSAESNIHIYNAPSNIKYDGTQITWTGNASSYAVSINGAPWDVTTVAHYSYPSDNMDFDVQIKALGNHSSTFDSSVVSDEFHYLSMIPEIFVENGIAKWNPIDGAEGYKIKIGGVLQNINLKATQYENISAGKRYVLSVMPYNNNGHYFSTWSQEKTIYILEAPKVYWNNDMKLDGEANNNFYWDAVNGADGYTVQLVKEGNVPEVTTYPEGQRSFAYAYTEVGKYTVQVKANAPGSNPDYYDSQFSTTINVERLPAPKAVGNDFIVSDKDDLAKGFTVNFQSVSGARGYQLYKEGEEMVGKFTTSNSLSDTNVIDKASIASVEMNYYIRSMGSSLRTVANKQTVVLDSLTSQSLSFKISVQPTPQNLTMSGTVLSWSAVEGVNSFTVAYSGTAVTAKGNQYDLSTIKAGTISVSVCSAGNGSNVLASNISAPITIQRLETPKNFKIKAEANGTLYNYEVLNAKSYEAYIGSEKTPVKDDNFTNIYNLIKTDGTTVSMVAVANCYNDNNTLYYMSSEISATQQFIRLAAPTFPEGALSNSVELLWNSPSNINTAEYTPTYRVFKGIDEQINGGDLNSTRFNIEYLEGGNYYTFYVKAIGNDTKYLDSDYSTVISAYKIKTPEIRLENGEYVWNALVNASTYYIEIDGVKVSDAYHESGAVYSYIPRFTTEGDHIVKIQAKGDGKGNLDSAFFTFTQKALILNAPIIQYNYSDNNYVEGGKIIVSVLSHSEILNSMGYQYEIGGQAVTSKEATFGKEISEAGKYTIRVKALGGSFDNNGIYYIDSHYAGGSVTDYINILPPINASSIRITTDGLVKWDSVSGSYGYEYQIAYNGEDFGTSTELGYNTNTFVVENYNQYKTITIRIRVRGDNIKNITSDWIEWTWTNSNLA